MFLVHTLLVFIAIYSVSALLAETIFTSHTERKIPTAVRVGLGYFLSLFYFISAWLFLSIRQAWILGLILLGLYLYGKTSKGLLTLNRDSVKVLLKKHLKTLGVFLVSANLFFLPLHLAGHYGPFTEGGGDLSVYSDVAKRLTDFNLNALGLEENASLKDRFLYIKHLINKDYSQRYRAGGPDFINPPLANYQTNKIAFNLQLNPIQYTPCAQFAFLADETNHPVFFALLAFLYTLTLASSWGFFRRFGLIPAILAVLILGGSNALVSAFYNMYLLQSLSITFLALTLAVVPLVPLFSIPGLRVYGFGSTFIFLCYAHFFPIIAPLLIIASIPYFHKESEISESPKSTNKTKLTSNLCLYSPLAILFSFFILEIYVGYKAAVHFITGLISGFLSPSPNSYAGNSVLEFSDQWWTFMFGFASQQHFLPLMAEFDDMKLLFILGTRLGFFILAVGFLLVIISKLRPVSSQQQSKEIWLHIGVYMALGVVICIYSMMSQTSLYTQAKGAQYFLLCLYFVMLLPLAILYKSFGPLKLQTHSSNNKNSKKIFFATNFFVCLLFVFSAFLWVPKVVYAYRIGHHMDRSTILESSFYSEAKRIKTEDKNAFVIFEPRISADIYFPNQSFAGYKLIPTRHLILDEFFLGDRGGTGHRNSKLPSDFIKPEDIAHLWSLVAVKYADDQYKWKAERVFRGKSPYIYFTGHDYQRNFQSRPRFNRAVVQPDTSDWGMFSYLRNGTAMVYLPPGGPYNLEIKLLTRHDDSFEELEVMSKGIHKRADAGEFPSIKNMSTHGYIITLNFEFEANPSPRISLVSKYDKEYWFNARLNGKEMAQPK
jgi:hypothetical protein